MLFKLLLHCIVQLELLCAVGTEEMSYKTGPKGRGSNGDTSLNFCFMLFVTAVLQAIQHCCIIGHSTQTLLWEV